MNRHIIFNELQPGNVFAVDKTKGLKVQKLYRVKSKSQEWYNTENMYLMGGSHE